MNDYFMLSEDIQCYLYSDLRVQQAQEMREHVFRRRQEYLRRKLEQACVDSQKDITKACKEIASSGESAPELTGGGLDD